MTGEEFSRIMMPVLLKHIALAGQLIEVVLPQVEDNGAVRVEFRIPRTPEMMAEIAAVVNNLPYED